MTRGKSIMSVEELKEIMKEDKDLVRGLLERMIQGVLEAEMDEALQASKHERRVERLGYRSGYYTRNLVTRVGTLTLRVPQDRQGLFSTEVFRRYQRSEKALVGTLMEMYVAGVSTRKVAAITERLCGHEFGADTVSRLNQELEESLRAWSERRLEEEYPYMVVDARYESVREAGMPRQRAVQIAIGITWEGRRRILGVEMAEGESYESWKGFLEKLKERGLRGVHLVISDDHAGLKRAIAAVLPEAYWQRCYVHFLRNVRSHLPVKGDRACLEELKQLYEAENAERARVLLRLWLAKWGEKYPALCEWVEQNIEETWTFYRFPWSHRKQIRSTNMLERWNEEVARRTRVIRTFPNGASCVRLVRALAVEQDEAWQEGGVYLDMTPLKEQMARVFAEVN